jgi:hypothetical protein
MNESHLNICTTFLQFAPNPLGQVSYNANASITIEGIQKTIPLLSRLSSMMTGRKLEISFMRNFPKSREDLESCEQLKKLLDDHGSDKASTHNYHLLYGTILRDRERIKNVFEFGLGTNNTSIVSNMGPAGKAGASLRGFREFLPNAMIYGADIDRDILFCEDRIKTFYVDQTEHTTLDDLSSKIGNEFDLIIDDGLHAPHANLATLSFALNKVRIGGWIVIEDISPAHTPIWEVASFLLPSRFESHFFISVKNWMVFAVKRLA